MQILTFIGIGAMIIACGSAVISLCYMFAMYLDSRDTHIEPMTFEPKRTHKFPKIDISVAYKSAKVGQVLGARK